uniref:Growth arrest-specific protein 1 n=1 Tax=Aceria tosichella TaxID=561515 RepID=A0A6G1SAX4_9ACAR
MQLINNILQQTQLVIVFIFISQSIRSTQCHAIESGDSTAQAISLHPPEHARDQHHRPNVRWLNAKTAAAAAASETQLDQPPVASSASPASSSLSSSTTSVQEARFIRPTPTTTQSSIKPETQTRPTASVATSLTGSSLRATTITTEKPKPVTTEASPISSSSTKSNWIESFLANAENIRSNEQLQREQILNRIIEERVEGKVLDGELVSGGGGSTISEYVPSQAPTDSDEDPLESGLASTLTVMGNGSPTHEPNRSTDCVGTGCDDDGKTGPMDRASLLLESNNVSAVLALNGNEDGDRLNVVVTMATKQTLNCEQAYYQCGLRRVCAQALRVYDDECRGLISSWTNQCSARCLRATIALRSTEEGDDLVNCDCQNNEYCLQNKNRSAICGPEVEKAIEPKTRVSCSTASAICMADQLCSTAFDYYYQNCQTLFSQRHCSMRCNNSLAILYRQPKASKLIDCQCDGTEEFPCLKYKTYTERLCLNKHPQPPTPKMDIGDEGDGFEASGRTNIAIDDDANADSVSIEDVNSEGEEEDDGGRMNNDLLDNGDNWIPLVSGRFFTNLHQQDQRHKVRTQKQTTNNQQQRRPRNGTRHRTRSSELRGRSYVFALTSSASGLAIHWQPMLMSIVLLAVNLITYT